MHCHGQKIPTQRSGPLILSHDTKWVNPVDVFVCVLIVNLIAYLFFLSGLAKSFRSSPWLNASCNLPVVVGDVMVGVIPSTWPLTLLVGNKWLPIEYS